MPTSSSNRDAVVDAFLNDTYERSGHMAASNGRICSYALPIAWKCLIRDVPHVWVLDAYHTRTTQAHINAIKGRMRRWGYYEKGESHGHVLYAKRG